MHKWCAAKVPPAGRSFTFVCNCSSPCLFSYVLIFPRGAHTYLSTCACMRAGTIPLHPRNSVDHQLNSLNNRGLHSGIHLPFFFFSHSRARGERKRERGRVLKVNCFLKVSPPRPSHIEIWTSFGARYCEQAHGPLFLSTCNYTRPGYRSQMFIWIFNRRG